MSGFFYSIVTGFSPFSKWNFQMALAKTVYFPVEFQEYIINSQNLFNIYSYI